MPNTYVTFSDVSSNNLVREYTIPFLFLSKNDVKVISSRTSPSILSPVVWVYSEESFFNSTIVNGESNLPYGNYCVVQFGANYKIKYTPPVNSTHSVTIFRRTDSSKISQFNNGSVIQAQDLNNIILLSKYSSEEAIESAETSNISNISVQLGEKYDKTGGSISGNVQVTGNISATGQLQAGSLQFPAQTLGSITNLATPINNNDAVNKNYVDLAVANGGGGGGGGGGNATIPDDSITAEKLRKVAGEEAVTGLTMRDNSVTTSKIVNSNVTTAKIADNSITSDKIVSQAITTAKIQNLNVTTDKLADESVTSSKIADLNITSIKIANNAITNSKILNGTITASKLAGGSLVQDGSVSSLKLQNSGLSWSGNSASSQVPVELYQNGNIRITNGDVIVAGGKVIAGLYEKKLNYNVDFPGASANALNGTGPIVLEKSSVRPAAAYPFTSQTLIDDFSGQPLEFVPTGTSLVDPPGYDFYIQVSNKRFGKIGSMTIVQGLSGITGNLTWAQTSNGGQGSTNRFKFAYKAIANIPFNKIVPKNENSHISVDPTTSVITFAQVNFPAKYRLTLLATAQCTRVTGSIIVKPIGNDVLENGSGSLFDGYSNPPSTLFFAGFNLRNTVSVNVVTQLIIPGNTLFQSGVEYFYTDDSSSAPAVCHWDSDVAYPNDIPDAWKASGWVFTESNNYSYYAHNIARTQLIIERIPL